LGPQRPPGAAPGAAGSHQVVHQATPGGLGLSSQLLGDIQAGKDAIAHMIYDI